MWDFFTHLFDSSGFPPRWSCGTWTPAHGWLHIISDLCVWSAYVAIPCVLAYFVLRKKDVPFRTIFWLFGAFILFCGTTHLMEAIIFWWPAYRLAGLIKVLTAIVSWSTVFALLPLIPQALRLRGPEELEREIGERKRAEEQLRLANDHLEQRVLERTAELAQANDSLRQEIAERQRIENALREARDGLETRVRERTAELAEANAALHVRTGQQAAVSRFSQRALAGTDLNDLTNEAAGEVAQTLAVEYARVMELHSSGKRLVLRGGVGWKEGSLGRSTVASGPEFQSGITLRGNEEVICADWSAETRFQKSRLLEDHDVASSMTVVIPGTDRPYGVLGADTRRPRLFTTDDRNFLHAVSHVLATAIERKHAEKRAEAFAAELQRSNRELEDFAAVASHDLQEPLRKIQAFGDRLQTRCRETLGEQGRQYVERMQASATRMRTLIDDLLEYSRASSKAPSFLTVDLGAEARQVVSDLEGLIQQTSGRVDVGELPTIRGDATQMRQLLQNLIANALKFHKNGEPPVVRIDGEVLRGRESGDNGDRPGGRICRIVVADNGIGFENEYADQIFQIFRRLHGRSEYQGTGMGLAICKKIVERHGGVITASSAPGQGATFTVDIPMRDSESGETA